MVPDTVNKKSHRRSVPSDSFYLFIPRNLLIFIIGIPCTGLIAEACHLIKIVCVKMIIMNGVEEAVNLIAPYACVERDALVDVIVPSAVVICLQLCFLTRVCGIEMVFSRFVPEAIDRH